MIKQIIKQAYWITANTITPEWILSLNIPKRKPRTIDATEHKILLDLVSLAYEIKQLKGKRFSEEELKFKEKIFDGKVKHLRINPTEIQTAYLVEDEKANVVKKSIGIYTKFDTLSYDKFLANVDVVEKMLASLKGYHSLAAHGLQVKFVGSSDISSKAKYESGTDTILINSSKVSGGEEYAGLAYVIAHELGHRYLRLRPQSWNYDAVEWTTTKYSMTDSMHGEEKFAELFAMSNWKSKYGQFADKIKRFEDIIK